MRRKGSGGERRRKRKRRRRKSKRREENGREALYSASYIQRKGKDPKKKGRGRGHGKSAMGWTVNGRGRKGKCNQSLGRI